MIHSVADTYLGLPVQRTLFVTGIMVAKRFTFLGLLLFVCLEMNRVHSQPIINLDFLRPLNLPGINSINPQLRNIVPVSGLTDITSLAQSVSLTGSGGSEKQDSVGTASLIKLFTP